jgi:hypothetical protein
MSSFVKNRFVNRYNRCIFFKKNLYDMHTSNYNAEKRNEKSEA